MLKRKNLEFFIFILSISLISGCVSIKKDPTSAKKRLCFLFPLSIGKKTGYSKDLFGKYQLGHYEAFGFDFCYSKLEGYDAKSFKAHKSLIAVDKNHLWLGTQKASQKVDYQSFEVLFEAPISVFLAKDKNLIYAIYPYTNSVRIVKADTNSFQVLNNRHAKDKDNVWTWHLGGGVTDKDFHVLFEPLEQADPHSFRVLKKEYAVDKNNVWWLSKLVKGADPKTFRELSEGYGEDAKNKWHENKLIDKQDSKK